MERVFLGPTGLELGQDGRKRARSEAVYAGPQGPAKDAGPPGLLIGAAPFSLSSWQTLTTMAILFHHSNSRLPYSVEKWLCRIIVTPRMHGIHHSVILEETDANWGTIFSFPDYLHRTIRLNIPQEKIVIGLPVIRSEDELTLPKLVTMPVTAGHPDDQRPPGLMKRNERQELPRAVLANGTEGAARYLPDSKAAPMPS